MMVIRIATGGTGSLSFPGLFVREPDTNRTDAACLRLGTFDFRAGPASNGVWCRSACQMLAWRWGSASMDKFIDQVIGSDRTRIREDWQRLNAGDMIDCLLRVRVDATVRIVRFVAGRVDDGNESHIAGLLQDVTTSQQAMAPGKLRRNA